MAKHLFSASPDQIVQLEWGRYTNYFQPRKLTSFRPRKFPSLPTSESDKRDTTRAIVLLLKERWPASGDAAEGRKVARHYQRRHPRTSGSAPLNTKHHRRTFRVLSPHHTPTTPEMEEDTQWRGIENDIDDPEELQVIYRTLDSYQ